MPKTVGVRAATSAYLDPEAYEALTALGARFGIPVAELMRQSFANLLLRYRVQINQPSRN